MASILITDGEQRAALAAVRSLGRTGHDVFVCSAARRSLAGTSRFARAEARVPDPHHAPDLFIAELGRLIERWDVEVVLPIAEVSALPTLEQRELLRPAVVPFPAFDRFSRLCDKRLVLETAGSLGIGVPRQCTLGTPEDVASSDVRAMDFPLVVKPARSIIQNGRGLVKSSMAFVDDEPAFQRAVEAQPPTAYPLLVQERIVGPGVGIFLLVREKEPLGVFSHRRIREKPPAGGVSVFRESIPADPSLVSLSLDLLRAFDWEGVAMVEYKVDHRTGSPYLMEINGRFWGSLQLAIDSGVDFPAMLIDVVLGRRLEPVSTYRLGVRTRWWWGDVDHLIARLRNSRERLGLTPDAPGRALALVQFLAASVSGARNEVLRLSDPMPAIHETTNWFRLR